MQNWRDDYFHACGYRGINVDAARKILRHANTVQRAAEVDCSVSDKEARAYWEQRTEIAERSIRALVLDCDKYRDAHPDTLCVTFSGDPRGAVVCLVGTFQGHESFSIAVPSVGFTATQIDRLIRIGERVTA